tara:strand:+ start:884 stop:1144 length:261 start_codon:yes stop_codon:yes gene_type:complete
MIQKIINVFALASATVSVAVVGVGGYVYLNREAILEDVKEKAIEAVMGSMGGGLGGGSLGAPDLAPPTNPQASAPVPSGGLGVPTF